MNPVNFEHICTAIDEAITNETAINICEKSNGGSMMFTFVPYECSCDNDSIYISAENDSYVNIININTITYDGIEELYTILAGDTVYYITII